MANDRNRKKIREALKIVPNQFTSYDICDITGISITRISRLLREIPEVEIVPSLRLRNNVVWVKQQ